MLYCLLQRRLKWIQIWPLCVHWEHCTQKYLFANNHFTIMWAWGSGTSKIPGKAGPQGRPDGQTTDSKSIILKNLGWTPLLKSKLQVLQKFHTLSHLTQYCRPWTYSGIACPRPVWHGSHRGTAWFQETAPPVHSSGLYRSHSWSILASSRGSSQQTHAEPRLLSLVQESAPIVWEKTQQPVWYYVRLSGTYLSAVGICGVRMIPIRSPADSPLADTKRFFSDIMCRCGRDWSTALCGCDHPPKKLKLYDVRPWISIFLAKNGYLFLEKSRHFGD